MKYTKELINATSITIWSGFIKKEYLFFKVISYQKQRYRFNLKLYESFYLL